MRLRLRLCIQVQTNAMEPLLSADVFRDVLQVSRRTFESMVARKEVPPFILVGRQRRWRRSDVEAWIANLADAATAKRNGYACVDKEEAR